MANRIQFVRPRFHECKLYVNLLCVHGKVLPWILVAAASSIAISYYCSMILSARYRLRNASILTPFSSRYSTSTDTAYSRYSCAVHVLVSVRVVHVPVHKRYTNLLSSSSAVQLYPILVLSYRVRVRVRVQVHVQLYWYSCTAVPVYSCTQYRLHDSFITVHVLQFRTICAAGLCWLRNPLLLLCPQVPQTQYM